MDASAELTTTDVLVGGSYTVFGITGSCNGDAITSLVARGGFAGNDNLLFPDAPFFDGDGIDYVAGGVTYRFRGVRQPSCP